MVDDIVRTCHMQFNVNAPNADKMTTTTMTATTTTEAQSHRYLLLLHICMLFFAYFSKEKYVLIFRNDFAHQTLEPEKEQPHIASVCQW